jgi:predicted nucleotide-binding protein (sugar kinase/HSP70/actin superfamily)
MWLDGGKYGSVDPCFPSKIALAHIHNLLHKKQERNALDYIWFPSITHLQNHITHTMGNTSCPLVAGTPNVAKAAFTKEKDFFAENGVSYVDKALNFDDPKILQHHLFQTWGELLQITEDENDWACSQGWKAVQWCDKELEDRGLELLTKAEEENSVVLLLLGRPYHNDPGLNHDVLEEFQSLGYPVLSIRSIPKKPDYLKRFFADDLKKCIISDVFDMSDVWPENYSVNSVQKVWAAKFAARHKNVAVIDLSSFKCGHDAPTYGLIDSIIGTSKTPYSALHDIDANKPSGSIKIRVKTYAYSLERYREQLDDMAQRQSELERLLESKRIELVKQRMGQVAVDVKKGAPDTAAALDAAYNEYLEKDIRSIVDVNFKVPQANRNDVVAPVRFHKPNKQKSSAVYDDK